MIIKWITFICIITTAIASQAFILLDLENFEEKSSGGGFIEYGFGIKLNIFITIVIILGILLISKYLFHKKINIILNIFITIVTALIIYNANVIIFEKYYIEDNNQNSFIIEISYELYSRKDIYRNMDNFYIGLIQKY